MTKDELFVLKLFELATAKGDATEEIDSYVVGRAIGQNDRGIYNIVKHLAQANFIKKGDENAIFLTPQGLALVEHLQETKRR
jgi:hypothetical protein